MRKQGHILYVEDDPYLSYVTRDNLELKGYQVTWCKDGEEGLECFKSGDFDVCILDVMLPKLDGFSLAKMIRKLNDEVPIIFLTAKSLKEDKIEGLTLGGDDYMTKPFSIEELVLKIEIFLKRKYIVKKASENETASFTIGIFDFDYAKLELVYENSKQRLTLKEAELLRMFCLQPNQVVKRSDILTQIWGEDDYFKGRSLDVFISRLRKYLSKDSRIEIENVHGVGFVMKIRND